MIHYELPNNSEIFVHRSGRTGRAGKKGSAILVYTQDQSRAVRTIEQDVGCKFTEVKINFFFICIFLFYLYLSFLVFLFLVAAAHSFKAF